MSGIENPWAVGSIVMGASGAPVPNEGMLTPESLHGTKGGDTWASAFRPAAFLEVTEVVAPVLRKKRDVDSEVIPAESYGTRKNLIPVRAICEVTPFRPKSVSRVESPAQATLHFHSEDGAWSMNILESYDQVCVVLDREVGRVASVVQRGEAV